MMMLFHFSVMVCLWDSFSLWFQVQYCPHVRCHEFEFLFVGSNVLFSSRLRTLREELWPRKSTFTWLEGNELPFMHLLVTTDAITTKHAPSGVGKTWREGGREGEQWRTDAEAQVQDASKPTQTVFWGEKGNVTESNSSAGSKIPVYHTLCLIGTGALLLGPMEGKCEWDLSVYVCVFELYAIACI